MNKKAAVGEGILTVYRIILIALICFIVLGISSIFYYYDINIRNVEARILSRNILLCLAENGNFDATIDFNEEIKYSLLDHCQLKGDLKRLHVNAKIFDSENNEIIQMQQGDSGMAWTKNIPTKQLQEFKPGSFASTYKITLRKPNGLIDNNAKLRIEVFVNADV